MYRSKFISYSIFFFGGIILLLTFYYSIDTSILIISNYDSFIFVVLNFLILFFEILTSIYGIFLIFHIAYIFIPQTNFVFPNEINFNPIVTIIIPTYNPDLYAVETNLYQLQNLTYKNVEIIITDNSDNLGLAKEIGIICDKFNVKYIHRQGTKGFKARNLNNAIAVSKGKYFFIIDIDQSIKINAIEKMIYIFENSNSNLAFIQGRFEIENANNIIRNSIAILYTFFYYVISLAKSSRGTVLFNGSSACFKTAIIKTIGGFPEISYTEDIEISYKLIIEGYTSMYLNLTVTTALVAWKLSDLLSSFWRWTYGGTSILRNEGKNIIRSSKLPFHKKIELILNGFSFLAFSGILIVVTTVAIMYVSNIELIRPVFSVFNLNIPLILVFPTIISVSHLLSCLIGLIESKSINRIPYLIPYSFASLIISFFIIIPTFYALLGINKADSDNSKWNRKFSLIKVLPVLGSFLLFYLYIFLNLLNENDLLWITFAVLSLSIFLTIIFLIKDKNIDNTQENFIYFSNFRVKNSLPLDSKYNYGN